MSSPGGARNAPENEATVAFLRERIRMAKQQMEAAAKALERMPHSAKAKSQYAESFYWYCLALYESSIYATDGVAPTGFVPPN
jgi:hypothetical protein